MCFLFKKSLNHLTTLSGTHSVYRKAGEVSQESKQAHFEWTGLSVRWWNFDKYRQDKMEWQSNIPKKGPLSRAFIFKRIRDETLLAMNRASFRSTRNYDPWKTGKRIQRGSLKTNQQLWKRKWIRRESQPIEEEIDPEKESELKLNWPYEPKAVNSQMSNRALASASVKSKKAS